MKRMLGKVKRAAAGIISDISERYVAIPNDAKRIALGKSHTGKPIYAYKFGNSTKSIVLSAGIHGNEVGTVKLAHQTIAWLANEAKLPSDVTVFVIPVLNPDGFAEARKKPSYLSGSKIGRLNAKGVDLNRNFNTKSFMQTSQWSFGKNYGEAIEVFAGEAGGSEPETITITNFVQNTKPKLWISFHNAGRDVLPSKDATAVNIAKIFSDTTGFKLLTEKEWKELKQTGTPKEWCEEHSISFVEVEGSTRWSSDWVTIKRVLPQIIERI